MKYKAYDKVKLISRLEGQSKRGWLSDSHLGTEFTLMKHDIYGSREKRCPDGTRYFSATWSEAWGSTHAIWLHESQIRPLYYEKLINFENFI